MTLTTAKIGHLKVLHVVHWPVSGISALLKNIIARMPPSEVSSHVLFFHEDAQTIADFAEICKTVRCLPAKDGYLPSVLEYREVIREVAPDILHSHSFQPLVWGTLTSPRRLTHITTVHSNYPYFTGKGIKNILKRNVERFLLKYVVRRAVAVGRGVHTLLLELGISSERLVLIENGVNTAARSVSQETGTRIRQELGLSENQFVLVTLGRLDLGTKGYDVLLHAMKRACERHENLILLFVGDGPDKARLIDMAAELGVTEHVRFLGHKRDPQTYLSVARAYVSSSIVEGFGLAVAEAMVNELPVIATRVGIAPDLITHGVSGVIVEPNDAMAIATAIDEFVAGRYSLEEMGRRGRAEVVRKCDIDMTAAAYLDLYRLLSKGHAARV